MTDRVGARTLTTRSMILMLFASFFAMAGFYLLLSVVPLYAEEAGGGSSGAGLATAAFMLSTVIAQVWMPHLLARFGYRSVLARSEEHTSELQSRQYLVCRLLLEKTKKPPPR